MVPWQWEFCLSELGRNGLPQSSDQTRGLGGRVMAILLRKSTLIPEWKPSLLAQGNCPLLIVMAASIYAYSGIQT